MYNRQRDKSKATSKYIGVSYHKRDKHWTSRIRCNGKPIWLGAFKSDLDAARAYDAAAKKYHGEFAQLNFEESADSS